MKYSVIIPIYNMEKYLNDCIMSITNQKRKDVEIILVNDGSQDNSLKICNYFKKQYKNIIVIDKQNSGSMDSWIKGVEKSTGEYICFVDADDMIAENYFKEIDKYTNKDYDIVLFDYYKMYKNYNKKFKVNQIPYGKINKKNLKYLQENYYTNYEQYSLYRWDKVIKATIIKENILKLNYRCTYFEDHPISFLNLIKAKSLYYIDKPLYYYRMRKSSVSHKVNSNIFKDNINIEREMKCIAKENNYDEKQIYNIHLYFLFQYARWALKTEENPKDKLTVTFKDIKNIKSIQQKLIIILYKFRLKNIFKLLNHVNHRRNDNKLEDYFE